MADSSRCRSAGFALCRGPRRPWPRYAGRPPVSWAGGLHGQTDNLDMFFHPGNACCRTGTSARHCRRAAVPAHRCREHPLEAYEDDQPVEGSGAIGGCCGEGLWRPFRGRVFVIGQLASQARRRWARQLSDGRHVQRECVSEGAEPGSVTRLHGRSWGNKGVRGRRDVRESDTLDCRARKQSDTARNRFSVVKGTKEGEKALANSTTTGRALVGILGRQGLVAANTLLFFEESVEPGVPPVSEQREYRIVTAARTSAMQNDLTEAAAEGFRVIGAGFGYMTAVMAREGGSPPTPIEYRLIGMTRVETGVEELQAAGAEGFRVAAMSEHGQEGVFILHQHPARRSDSTTG